MQRLRAGASAYATGAVAAYLQDNIPGVRLLECGQRLVGEVVLYGLPPESDLTNWTASGRVSFAWGPKTLEGIAPVNVDADYNPTQLARRLP